MSIVNNTQNVIESDSHLPANAGIGEASNLSADIAKLQAENARLNDLVTKFRAIVLHATAEQREDVCFICGKGGPIDEMRLPKTLLVCPAFGLDGFAVYTKTSDYSAPGY